MMRLSSITCAFRLALLLLSAEGEANAQIAEFHGQASAWGGFNDTPKLVGRLGLHYVPTLFGQTELDAERTLALELSAHVSGFADFPSGEPASSDLETKLYRFWARLTDPQLEIRLGLQRISFGSATLFRPLMWFDSIDPRDPLQLTDGVYALLLRYYFLDNANVWLWGVYGRDVPKGWEAVPSKDKSLEYGGRLQLPVLTGEAGITFHRRLIEIPQPPSGMAPPGTVDVPENRFGLDVKLDVGIGIWFEGTITHQETDLFPYPWQHAVTVGGDYTFDVGTGLNVLAEYFAQVSATEAFGHGESVKIPALSVNYAVSMLDNIGAIVYYEWRNKDMYAFLDWRRTYDDWVFHLIGFWNPPTPLLDVPSRDYTAMAGKGLQLLVTFNH